MDDGQLRLPERVQESPRIGTGFADADELHLTAGEVVILDIHE
jgi:hypothetical protein